MGRAVAPAVDPAVVMRLARMGNNLNQVARSLNAQPRPLTIPGFVVLQTVAPTWTWCSGPDAPAAAVTGGAHQVPCTWAGSARRAVDYLLGERDHAGRVRDHVQVLVGDPDKVAAAADALGTVHRYSSAVIAFHPDDRPSAEEIAGVLPRESLHRWADARPVPMSRLL